MFHITKENNLSNILTNGLIPGKRRGLTTSLHISCHGKQCRVFLTNDIDRIIETQAGKKWIQKHKAIALKIDTSELEISPVEYSDGMTYTISDFEFYTSKISPEHIKYSHKLYL